MSSTSPALRGTHDVASPQASSQPISQLIMQLVGRMVTQEKGDQLKLAQYVLRILGSRLPPAPINDEYALVSLMKKNLVNTKSVKEAIELENLYNQLNRLGTFSQLKFSPSTTSTHAPNTLKFSMLYLLYQLRQTTGMPSLIGGQQTVLIDESKQFLLSDLDLRPAPIKPTETAPKHSIPSSSAAQGHVKRHVILEDLPESKIVRDLLFVLQGLEGEWFKYNSQTDRFELSNTAKVSRPVRILALRIAELGALFSKVRQFLEKTQVSNSSVSSHQGLIAQSFREGVAEEVVSYYRMISVLEAQVTTSSQQQDSNKSGEKSVSSDNGASKSTSAQHGGVDTGMTLRKLAVWTSEPLRRMKWLYMVIENDMKGGQAGSTAIGDVEDRLKLETAKISALQAHNGGSSSQQPSGALASHDLAASRMHQLTQLRSHGDPYLNSLGRTLEVYTSRPVLNMIQNWIFQGSLNDPYKEFFVIKNDAIVPRVAGAVGEASRLDHNHWVWSEQYLVLHSRIPPFISHKLAHKIMVIGKSINFMKHCCKDGDWIAETTRKIHLQLPSDGIQHFDQLRHPIHQLYEVINTRLVHLIIDKFHLLHHVEAIRKYLFLGQGDLIQILMESLEPELSLPVGKQYRHNLLPIVDGAIRSSVANSWPSYLQDRCEIYLPTAKDLAKDGHIFGDMHAPQDGWNIFELAYKLTSPLDAILGSFTVVQQHRAIFRFLWRLRRTQFILSGTWRLTTNCTRQLTGLVPEIIPLMQQVHLLRHQMTHFTSNIQYYIMFEVLETAWQVLETQVQKAKSLDDIVTAYAEYVRNILNSSLVDDPHAPRPTQEECVEQGYEQEMTPAQMIWEVLEIIREFDERVQEIYTSAHEVAVRREAARSQEPELDEDGNPTWGLSEADEKADMEFLDHLDNVLFPGIETITDQYKHSFDQLFTSLAHRMREGDNVYLQNLFQRVNFNSFYASESQAHIQANPESASAILQATLGSVKEAASGILTPSGLHSRLGGFSGPNSRAGGVLSGLSTAAPMANSSMGSVGSAAISSATSSAEYTESVLKQAAAKLRLSNLSASAHSRSASSTASPTPTPGSSGALNKK